MTTTGQVQRSIQRFQEFASDLIRSDMDTFSDRLALFIHFCESDEFFASINVQLVEVAQDGFDAWLKERMETQRGMSGSGDLSFPVDLDTRTAYQFEILRRFNSGAIQLFGFTPVFFTVGSKISDHIRALNEAITKPLAREMKHKLEEIAEKLPDDKRAEVPPAIFQVFQNVGNYVHQQATGSNISQVATIGHRDEINNAFAELRAAIAAYEQDQLKLREHIETIEAAEQLAVAEKPKESAIKVLLGSLPSVASIAASVSTILKLLFQ